MKKICKFGGTSIANAKYFLHVADIIKQKNKKEQIAVVLSAPSGITKKLVKIIKNIDYPPNISSIENFFYQQINFLNINQEDFDFLSLYNIIFSELKKFKFILSLRSFKKYCKEKINAKIISFGERISIEIMKSLLLARKHNVSIINPVKKLLSNGGYLESCIDISESTKRIKNMNIPKNNIILMSGFIGGNKNGELVVLGRNGSDYSASSLAVCLNAYSCEIWTDVSGIYTLDPSIALNAKLIKYLSYQEAIQLSFFGSKILHPKTIKPIYIRKIPCYVKNTNLPENKGTLISFFSNNEDKIKGISCLNNVVIIKIICKKILKFSDILNKINIFLNKKNIVILIKNFSFLEESISLCIQKKSIKDLEKFLLKEFFLELKKKYLKYVKTNNKLSMITIISDIYTNKSIYLRKLINYLSFIKKDVVYINYGYSKNLTSIILKQKHIYYQLKSIHNTIFSKKKIINILIIGSGNIGKTLITQIHNLRNKNIFLRICVICNTKKMLININGIDLNRWKSLMEETKKKFKIKNLINLSCLNYKMDNSVMIDCTNSEKISNYYVKFLLNGFHVITPNKKANTGTMQYYKQIRNAAKISCRKFIYETNVGAGLPVINTLKNLLNTGDKLRNFYGILSGSLSFIFGKLDDGITLSKSILEAINSGYTEPDPRDDLLGIDVARKLLILAREIGLNLELSDIKIPYILPKNFNFNEKLTDFLNLLSTIDDYYNVLVSRAHKKGQVFRYVSCINEKSCEINIKTVNSDDPLFQVKNGENALVFYTKNYNPLPLLIRGYGAGHNVTVSGIISDLLSIFT